MNFSFLFYPCFAVSRSRVVFVREEIALISYMWWNHCWMKVTCCAKKCRYFDSKCLMLHNLSMLMNKRSNNWNVKPM